MSESGTADGFVGLMNEALTEEEIILLTRVQLKRLILSEDEMVALHACAIVLQMNGYSVTLPETP